jgi:MFS family permease
LIAWAKNWEANVVYSSSTYITSYFNSLNLASLISVVLYIVETVLLPFYAKLADMVGRTESFAISIFFYVLSGIVQAVAPNMDTLVVTIIFIMIIPITEVSFSFRVAKLFML